MHSLQKKVAVFRGIGESAGAASPQVKKEGRSSDRPFRKANEDVLPVEGSNGVFFIFSGKGAFEGFNIAAILNHDIVIHGAGAIV